MIISGVAGCKVSLKWDWSDKKSAEQQAVLLYPGLLAQVGGLEADYPNKVIDTRLRMKGTGKTFTVRFESVPGKDLILLGHSIDGVARTMPEARK